MEHHVDRLGRKFLNDDDACFGFLFQIIVSMGCHHLRGYWYQTLGLKCGWNLSSTVRRAVTHQERPLEGCLEPETSRGENDGMNVPGAIPADDFDVRQSAIVEETEAQGERQDEISVVYTSGNHFQVMFSQTHPRSFGLKPSVAPSHLTHPGKGSSFFETALLASGIASSKSVLVLGDKSIVVVRARKRPIQTRSSCSDRAVDR